MKNARTCQLEVLSRQSFPGVYSHNPTSAARTGVLGSCPDRGQPEPGQAHLASACWRGDGSLSSTGLFYVSLALRPANLPPPPPPPPPPLPNRYTPGSTGYDVSWPQCQAAGSLSQNHCPARRTLPWLGKCGNRRFQQLFLGPAAWAGQGLSVYIVLQPAPARRPGGLRDVRAEGSCAASNNLCVAYNWGYNYAEADLAFPPPASNPGSWLDVETAEGWSTRQRTSGERGRYPGSPRGPYGRRRDGRDLLHVVPVGPDNGIVHTPCGVPIWVAGASSLTCYHSAQSYCQRALSAGDLRPSSTAIGFASSPLARAVRVHAHQSPSITTTPAGSCRCQGLPAGRRL